MLTLYLLLLGALALFTAYTQNFQRTIAALQGEVGAAAGAALMPRTQGLRTVALLVGWPLAFGLGIAFIAWWKAVALLLAAFLVLVPLLGSLTPRPMSPHYLACIRSDLARRIAAGTRDAGELRRVIARLDRVTPASRS